MDDNKIVDLFLHRNDEAIKETAEKYGSRLYSLAFSIVKDRETAEECVEDTYMKAWNSIPPNEPGSYLYAFLARITRHIALNCCRDRSRLKRRTFLCELSEEMEQCLPSPDDIECRMDNMALREAINGFLDLLKEENRNIFLRRYWYLDSIAAISHRYGLSESKVKTTLFRIRIQFRKYLEKEGYTL